MRMSSLQRVSLALFTLVFISGCFPNRQNFQPRTIENSTSTEIINEQSFSAQNTSTPRFTLTIATTATITPTALEVLPTSLPNVTVAAVDGNLFIRRGPGLEYNSVGVLYEGKKAKIIGRDILSGWVQINIPKSKSIGWVSIQTQFSKITGDLDTVPSFTFTDWSQPAYIKNCTEHDMFIEPAGLYLYSLYANASGENEVQVNPGEYIVYDVFVEDLPEVARVSVREGITAYITINGLEVKHKCP